MERNSLGQVIVNESGSSVVSILALEQSITLNQYNRFLLNNKEFTELVPTIDKDALIRELTNQVDTLNNSVNSLTTDLKGGFLVSATESQFAFPRAKPNAVTYNGQQVYENIGFNDDSTTPNFNSRQSNGQKFWSIPDKVARIFLEANSQGQYTMKANIKYRIKYVGTTNITNITRLQLGLQFWKNGTTALGTLADSGLLSLTKANYAPNESSDQEFSISIQLTGGLGELRTDILYLSLRSFSVAQNNIVEVADKFLLEVLPGSTFSLLPV
jgi:hypothetical protein